MPVHHFCSPFANFHLFLTRYLCLHACPPPVAFRAAFEGNLDELRRMLPSLTHRQRLQLDSQGNTVSALRLQALLGIKAGRIKDASGTSGQPCHTKARPRDC